MIIAPNVTRFSVVGSFAGQPVVNTIDMNRIIVTGGPIDVPEWNVNRALLIATAYNQNFAGRLSNQMLWDRVDWIDLGSIDGDVGSGGLGGGGFPSQGAASTSAFPANVSIRLRKVASGQRGSRPGSMYLAGGLEAETSTNPNELTSSNITAWNTDSAAFLADICADSTFDWGTATARMVIVRTRRPNPEAQPEFVGMSPVQELLVQSRLASQRRRLTL